MERLVKWYCGREVANVTPKQLPRIRKHIPKIWDAEGLPKACEVKTRKDLLDKVYDLYRLRQRSDMEGRYVGIDIEQIQIEGNTALRKLHQTYNLKVLCIRGISC